MSDVKERALEIARAAAAKAKTAQEAIAAADAARAAAAPATTPAKRPAAAPTEKKLSPKHKSSRGVPEGYVTTWVPLDLPAGENERLLHVAAVRDTKIGSLLARILVEQLDARRAEFDADLAKYVPSPKAGEKAQERLEKMDVGQLEAEVAKQQAAIQRLLDLAAAKRAESAAKTETS